MTSRSGPIPRFHLAVPVDDLTAGTAFVIEPARPKTAPAAASAA